MGNTQASPSVGALTALGGEKGAISLTQRGLEKPKEPWEGIADRYRNQQSEERSRHPGRRRQWGWESDLISAEREA